MKKSPAKKYRLRSAKAWINTYTGSNIVKGYGKKYAVDKLCAVRELRMIGIQISEEYEKLLMNSMEAVRHQRLASGKKREEKLNAGCTFESDENFAMIIGYTSGGFPYGVTHEEMEKINKTDENHTANSDEIF